ncbi:MAG: VWA domain-containing protein [Clostridiales bacterium]|nr:VWA domain-containing protein [Clostridiales bacterium]
MIHFANWWFLLLIPVVIFMFMALGKKRGLNFSSVKLLRSAGYRKTVKHKIGKILVCSGLILAVIALARPQTEDDNIIIMQQGIDIALILDVSGSMQSVDFEPNRLEVAKNTIGDFIDGRRGDRVSLIIFAGMAFTRIPLTLDHDVVHESLAGVTSESVNLDGTAIGSAISVGLNRLRNSDTESSVMILVTDGDNNAGEIDPMTAGRLAEELGIKIYTIGVGTDTLILPVDVYGGTRYQQFDGGFDEGLLMRLAEMTGGQYFRATDESALSQIFRTIDQLEKTEFDDDGFREYNELAFPLILAALVLLLAGIFFDRYFFVQIP